MADVKQIAWAYLVARPEFMPLADAYAKQAGNPEFGQWRINKDWYADLERSGLGQAFGVFEDDKLVGFAYTVLNVQPHFTSITVLAVDAIYVAPDARKKNGGLALLRALKAHAKAMKADGLLLGAKLNTDAHRLYEAVAKPMNTLFWWQV
jgi:GNAT superfamily N-acetyltransferase